MYLDYNKLKAISDSYKRFCCIDKGSHVAPPCITKSNVISMITLPVVTRGPISLPCFRCSQGDGKGDWGDRGGERWC